MSGFRPVDGAPSYPKRRLAAPQCGMLVFAKNPFFRAPRGKLALVDRDDLACPAPQALSPQDLLEVANQWRVRAFLGDKAAISVCRALKSVAVQRHGPFSAADVARDRAVRDIPTTVLEI